MDVGISLHYDKCPEKKTVFGPNFGVKNMVRHKLSCEGKYFHGLSFSSI